MLKFGSGGVWEGHGGGIRCLVSPVLLKVFYVLSLVASACPLPRRFPAYTVIPPSSLAWGWAGLLRYRTGIDMPPSVRPGGGLSPASCQGSTGTSCVVDAGSNSHTGHAGKLGLRISDRQFFRVRMSRAWTPWWCSGFLTTCQCGGHSFDPWSRKTSHVVGQRSLSTAATEARAPGPGSRDC